jgi:PleD family two-component response regulator
MTARVLVVDDVQSNLNRPADLVRGHRRADRALYRSKSAGRNRVTHDAA